MNKYCISGSGVYNDIIGGGASAKAPADVARIARNNGYELMFLKPNDGDRIKKNVACFFNMQSLQKQIGNQDEVLIQYPQHHLLLLNMLFGNKPRKVRYLIHDINSIRVKGKLGTLERLCLNMADELIVHSPEMCDYLKPLLKKTITYRILECFDYIVDIDENDFKRKISLEICFAGNIDKSVFLHKLMKSETKGLKFHLYGLMKNKPENTCDFIYEGAFKPDLVAGLKGSWGLVWDGTEIDSCGGTFGEYLSVIAPHKFSLYIVAGIPPIVWSKSAMASIVKKKNIGLCIESLSELSDTIKRITPAMYRTYTNNLLDFAKKISKGENLRTIL